MLCGHGRLAGRNTGEKLSKIMIKKILLACILLFALDADASDRITASITVTNQTLNGYTLTVNGNVRTWTNSVVTPSTQIATNNDVTGCGSKTNLVDQVGANLFSNLKLLDTGSNSIQLQGDCGGALSVSIGGTWASVSYSTQTCATATPVGVPFANYYPPLLSRTNTATQLVSDLNSYSTSSLDQNDPIASQLLGTNNVQTIFAAKTFLSPSGVWKGSVSQLNDSANVFRGGYESNVFIDNSVFTNAVNRGNAFSSPGSGSLSEQFGIGSTATAFKSTTVGGSVTASFGTSIGHESVVSGVNGFAGGADVTVSGSNGVAIGAFANVSADNAAAYGPFATAAYSNSISVGPNSATTGPNQIMLGTAGISTVVQNNLTVQTNLNVLKDAVVAGNFSPQGLTTNQTWIGTNTFGPNSDIAFSRFPLSTLANGNNTVIAGTNVFIEVSGPSAAFSIIGIAGGRDGKLIIIVNQTGQNMTIATEGGATGNDPTPANRIISMTGADEATTGNGAAMLIYSGAAQRWLLISLKQ